MIRLIKNDVAFIKVRTKDNSVIGLDLSIWFDNGGHGKVKPFYFIRQTVAQKVYLDSQDNEWSSPEIHDDCGEVFQTLPEAEAYIKSAVASNTWNDEPLVF